MTDFSKKSWHKFLELSLLTTPSMRILYFSCRIMMTERPHIITKNEIKTDINIILS